MSVILGDCLDVMPTLDAESIDAIVTDPPYGLGFMGKDWDSPGGLGNVPMRRRHEMNTVNTGVARQGGRQRSTVDFQRRMLREGHEMQAWHEAWAIEAFRVAKPGAHLLAFGGTRTYHRLACAIEDAGWEVRDCLVWAYASGFPKSLNLKDAEGKPNGLGTALKPAWEPIILARKPLRGTVAANVQRFGTGALNVDATRIGTDGGSVGAGAGAGAGAVVFSDGLNGPRAVPVPGLGRWPANVILTDPIFDGGVPGVVGGGEQSSTPFVGAWAPRGAFPIDNPTPVVYGDSGTYSRFFLVPKASRSDREPVLGGGARPVDARMGLTHGGPGEPGKGSKEGYEYHPKARANVHPTVKPLDLMRHLVRLVAPPGGVVLDPFLGSGTTALACELEGFGWIGIEKEAEYVAIAEARLNGTQRGMGLGA